MNKKLFTPLFLIVIFALIVSACQGGKPAPAGPPDLQATVQAGSAAAGTAQALQVQINQACTSGVEGVLLQSTPYPCPAAPPAAPSGPAATAPVSVAPTAGAPSGGSTTTLTCSDGSTVQIPLNGLLFKATGGDDYNVVYDPSQSGAADLPPKGWWWQPCLPGPNRQAHEVAITLQQGNYRFVGPECQAWLNTDGNKPFDQGTLLVNRANNPNLTVPATKSHEPEAWIFVRCRASDASGFSFALK